jgi:hypothetical protein
MFVVLYFCEEPLNELCILCAVNELYFQAITRIFSTIKC